MAWPIMGELKSKGQAEDLTMSEFADIYRQNRPYTRPECTLWKDILYGSRRQQFWYVDPWMRFCLDMNQGGAMIDLRPYAAKLERPVRGGYDSIYRMLPILTWCNLSIGQVTLPIMPVKER